MRRGAVNALSEPAAGALTGAVQFADRQDAGRQLALLLTRFRDVDPIVVAIPRGGVPVAYEVARALGAPLDIVGVRKIGAPQNPEYAIGAVAEGDVTIIDDAAVGRIGLGAADLAVLAGRVRHELGRRLARYGDHPRAAVTGRTVLLIDDGLATGHTAQAAACALRARGAARVILAVPVAAPQSAAALRDWVDDVICVETPVHMWAIGLWYDDFSPTSDDEVIALLREHAGAAAHQVAGASRRSGDPR